MKPVTIDFKQFKVLSFDCYGTLIDWEKGIVDALSPWLLKHDTDLESHDILKLYGRLERSAEDQTPFINYRSVLRQVMRGFSEEFNVDLRYEDIDTLCSSLKSWPVFPDTISALQQLGSLYQLSIISNIDSDLFMGTAATLQSKFTWVISADMVGSYKPSRQHFEKLFEMTGLPLERHLHIAQSLYHDIQVANDLEMSCVWVNRSGATSTPIIDTHPDLEVPDLKTLAELMVGQRGSQ